MTDGTFSRAQYQSVDTYFQRQHSDFDSAGTRQFLGTKVKAIKNEPENGLE